MTKSTVDPKWEEAFLAHVGVKGMKWGVRKKKPPLTGRSARIARRDHLRAKNKAFKLKEKQSAKTATKNWDTAIDKARANKGASKASVKKAKIKFKQNKSTLGRSEAKRILENVKTEAWANKVISKQTKSGKEATMSMMGTVGLATLAVVFAGVAAGAGSGLRK